MHWLSRNQHLLAAAAIMIGVTAAWFAMPRIMLMVSDGGPLVGALVAIAFMVAFFGIFWLRSRLQRRDEP